MRSAERGAIDELDEHAAGCARVEERNVALGAATRLAVDQLDAALREARERGTKVVDDIAQVMERALAPLGEEARDPRLRVGRLDELDARVRRGQEHGAQDRKSTRLNSSHQIISYAVFCLKKKR